jgi:hypothetical protein
LKQETFKFKKEENEGRPEAKLFSQPSSFSSGVASNPVGGFGNNSSRSSSNTFGGDKDLQRNLQQIIQQNQELKSHIQEKEKEREKEKDKERQEYQMINNKIQQLLAENEELKRRIVNIESLPCLTRSSSNNNNGQKSEYFLTAKLQDRHWFPDA